MTVHIDRFPRHTVLTHTLLLHLGFRSTVLLQIRGYSSPPFKRTKPDLPLLLSQLGYI